MPHTSAAQRRLARCSHCPLPGETGSRLYNDPSRNTAAAAFATRQPTLRHGKPFKRLSPPGTAFERVRCTFPKRHLGARRLGSGEGEQGGEPPVPNEGPPSPVGPQGQASPGLRLGGRPLGRRDRGSGPDLICGRPCCVAGLRTAGLGAKCLSLHEQSESGKNQKYDLITNK